MEAQSRGEHSGEQLDLNSSELDGEDKAVSVPLHTPCSPHPQAATHLPARCEPLLSLVRAEVVYQQ